jgi:hypothetical protein
MTYYGYTPNENRIPNDNVWLEDNELILNDDSVVYGYEGSVESSIGITILNKEDFLVWSRANVKSEI